MQRFVNLNARITLSNLRTLYSVNILSEHEERATRELGFTGSQEKAVSCPNKMLALYNDGNVEFCTDKSSFLHFIFFCILWRGYKYFSSNKLWPLILER
jgi:hypothetical protein